LRFCLFAKLIPDRFSEPIPRKGTETRTFSRENIAGCKYLMFFRTYSPQGDGNLGVATRISAVSGKVFQNLFPARGRKPLCWIWRRLCGTGFFRTYSPQGDGNFCFGIWIFCTPQVFQNLFPARGRKHRLLYGGVCSAVPEMFFRTYSPQGDGNLAPLQLLSSEG